MKKIIISILSISIVMIASAKSPFKERIKGLGQDVNILAKENQRAWFEIDQLHNALSDLEDKAMLKKYKKACKKKHQKHQKNFEQALQNVMIENDESNDNQVLIINPSMLE